MRKLQSLPAPPLIPQAIRLGTGTHHPSIPLNLQVDSGRALISALAGPTELLGKVRLQYAERDGQSLLELCTGLAMKHQITMRGDRRVH